MRPIILAGVISLSAIAGASAVTEYVKSRVEEREAARHAPAYDIGQPAVCPEGTTRIDIIQGKTRSQACMGGLIRP